MGPRNPFVLRVITRLNVGGPARHAVILDRELPRRGFDCELVSGAEGEREGLIEPGPHSTWTRIPDLRRPLHPRRDLRALRALTRLIRARRPDIVHTHMAKAGTLGRLAARRAGVPRVVHTYHGHVLEGYFPRPLTRAFLETERRLARHTDVLIAVSPQIRDELLDLGIGRTEQWRVVPVGLDLDPLVDSSLQPPQARARLGLPAEGPLIGIVGRLVPIKDHETFLAAAVRIAADRPGAGFVVAGDGELRDSLEARARRLLGPRVRFLGWVEDLEALYRALDVVVLTSRNEGTPVALIEAGAAARPVVATGVGGVQDVVRGGETGTIVPAQDPAAVATAVLTLLADTGRAREMGEIGRLRMAERHGAGRLVANVAGVYRDLLAEKPHAGGSF